VLAAVSIVVHLASDLLRWVLLVFWSHQSLQAEVLFLRRQLALYVERGAKPRRIDAATRVSLALLSRWFAWRSALVVVRPQTLIRWHRAGFRLLWTWKSRLGRPSIPVELRGLIRRMALENPLWGQERIANELLEARNTHLAAYCPQVPAEATARAPTPRPALVDISENPCAGDRCMRFPRHRHDYLPTPVRIGGRGAS
jgi:hypothetical protein